MGVERQGEPLAFLVAGLYEDGNPDASGVSARSGVSSVRGIPTMALISRIFSICPRIREAGDRLIATTAWRYRLLTLGASYREVVIDPIQKVVRIRRRFLWIFRRFTVVPFSSVKTVTYGYDSWSADAWWSWTYDGFDIYSVGLGLHNGKDVHLFNFLGEGSFT